MKRLILGLALASAASSVAWAEPPAIDDPQVSRSRGEAGGVVVLWTRVIPRTDDAALATIAADVQSKVAAAVARALPGSPTDRRPSPERVCPRAACLGMAASGLLLHRHGGCAVVLLVSPPGASPMRLIPWVGKVTVAAATVPFREPPEGIVRVKDFVSCDRVAALLAEPAPAVDAALVAASK